MFKIDKSISYIATRYDLIHQLHYNRIDTIAYEYAPGFIIFKLNNHSNNIQEFINNLMPAGIAAIYDISSTYNICGSCFMNASFLQNLKYKFLIWLYKSSNRRRIRRSRRY